MVAINRRSAMRVRNGRVLKKNNWRLDPSNYRAVRQDEIRLERRRPPPLSRHLITISQLRTFIGLLPDWEEVAIGLDAIVLDDDIECEGWYAPGVVALCSWEHDLWTWWTSEVVAEHEPILDLLGVERVPIADSVSYAEFIEDLKRLGVKRPGLRVDFELRFTEAQARAYQLLHVLPHEL